jgi:hypothetical protein
MLKGQNFLTSKQDPREQIPMKHRNPSLTTAKCNSYSAHTGELILMKCKFRAWLRKGGNKQHIQDA